MKFIHLIFLFILFTFSCRRYNDNQIEHSVMLDSLRGLSIKLFENNSDAFLLINNKYLKNAESKKDSFYIGDAYWKYAEYYKKRNEIDSTIKYYNKSISVFSTSNYHKKTSQLLYNLASLQWVYMDYMGSESNLFKSLSLIENNPKQEILNYNLLGIIYLKTNEFKLSIEYFEKALELIKKHSKYENLYYSIYNNLGYLYKEIKYFPQSIKYYKESKKFLKKEDLEQIARHVNNINYVQFLNSGPSHEIEENLKSALIIRLENDYKTGICDSYLNLSKYYLASGKDSISLDYAHKGMSLAKEIKYLEDQLEFYVIFSKLNPSKIENYLVESNALRDSIDKSERQIRDKFSRIKYETDQYKLTANKLETANSYLRVIIALIVLVFILLALFFRQRTKSRQLSLKREFEKEKSHLFKLSIRSQEKLEKAKNEERMRIAMELHDGVLSALTSIRISLGLNHKIAKEKETEIDYTNELKKIELSIRNISHNLSNDEIFHESNFINLLKNTLESTDTLKVGVYQKDVIYWDDISDTIKVNIFRVIQESYRNTLIHANAKKFKLSFGYDNNELTIHIVDDGQGFNTSKRSKGIGLPNMKRRIQKTLQGSIKFHSDNTGTTTTIKISPLYHET